MRKYECNNYLSSDDLFYEFIYIMLYVIYFFIIFFFTFFIMFILLFPQASSFPSLPEAYLLIFNIAQNPVYR